MKNKIFFLTLVFCLVFLKTPIAHAQEICISYNAADPKDITCITPEAPVIDHPWSPLGGACVVYDECGRTSIGFIGWGGSCDGGGSGDSCGGSYSYSEAYYYSQSYYPQSYDYSEGYYPKTPSSRPEPTPDSGPETGPPEEPNPSPEGQHYSCYTGSCVPDNSGSSTNVNCSDLWCTISPPPSPPSGGNPGGGAGGSNPSGPSSPLPNPNPNPAPAQPPPPTSHSVTVIKTTGGNVKSNDNHINCGSVCSHSYLKNSSVTLQAIPASSYWRFAGWTGDCSGSGLCNLIVNTSKSVTALFSLRQFNYQEF